MKRTITSLFRELGSRDRVDVVVSLLQLMSLEELRALGPAVTAEECRRAGVPMNLERS